MGMLRRIAAVAVVAVVALAGAVVPTASSTAATLFRGSFEGGAGGWTTAAGSWATTATTTAAYATSSTSGEGKVVFADPALTNVTVEAAVRLDTIVTQAAAGIVARYVDADNYYLLRLQWDAQQLRLYRVAGGAFSLLSSTPMTITTGIWYELSLTANGSSLSGTAGGTAITATDATHSAGKSGLRTWGLAASYDNVRVSRADVTLAYDDFEAGASAWTVVAGTWAISATTTTTYSTTSSTGEAKTSAGTAIWGNVAVEAHLRIATLGSQPSAALAGRYVDANNYYMVRLQPDVQQVRLYRVVAGTFTMLASAPQTVTTGTWYRLGLTMVGTHLVGSVNGVDLVAATDASFAAGKVALRPFGMIAAYDDVRVVDAAAPAVPTSLAATNTSPSSQRLTWTDAATDETAYRVYRKLTSSGTWELWSSLPAGSTSFESIGLLGPAAYDHRVVATRGELESASSTVTLTGLSPSMTTRGTVIAPTGTGNQRNSDGDIIRAADGTLHFVYAFHQVAFPEVDTQKRLYHMTSTDDGATWSVPTLLFSTSPRGALQISLEYLSSGDLGMTYSSWGSSSDSRKVFRSSSDGGLTWSAEVDISSASFAYVTGSNDRLHLMDSGRLVQVAHTRVSSGAIGTIVFTSDDDGATWTLRTPAPMFADGGDMWEADAVETAPGEILLISRTRLGWLYSSRSTNDGASWSTPVRTELRYSVAPPKLEKLPGGGIVLLMDGIHRNTAQELDGDRYVLGSLTSTDAGVTWSNYRQLEYTGDGQWYHYPSIFFDAVSGYAHISYATGDPWGPLMYSRFDDDWFTATTAWPY